MLTRQFITLTGRRTRMSAVKAAVATNSTPPAGSVLCLPCAPTAGHSCAMCTSATTSEGKDAAPLEDLPHPFNPQGKYYRTRHERMIMPGFRRTRYHARMKKRARQVVHNHKQREKNVAIKEAQKALKREENAKLRQQWAEEDAAKMSA